MGWVCISETCRTNPHRMRKRTQGAAQQRTRPYQCCEYDWNCKVLASHHQKHCHPSAPLSLKKGERCRNHQLKHNSLFMSFFICQVFLNFLADRMPPPNRDLPTERQRMGDSPHLWRLVDQLEHASQDRRSTRASESGADIFVPCSFTFPCPLSFLSLFVLIPEDNR
jgi:hypothetical protein